MDIGDVILEVFGGSLEEPEYDDPDDLKDGLLDHFGSVASAAQELGVPRSTLRGWLAGRTPKGGRGRAVRSELRQRDRSRSLDSGREVAIRGTDVNGLRLRGTFVYTGGESMKGAEDRDVPIGDYLDPGVMDRLVDAYLDGASADQLGDVFADAINDGGFYAGTFGGSEGGTWDVEYLDGVGE